MFNWFHQFCNFYMYKYKELFSNFQTLFYFFKTFLMWTRQDSNLHLLRCYPNYNRIELSPHFVIHYTTCPLFFNFLKLFNFKYKIRDFRSPVIPPRITTYALHQPGNLNSHHLHHLHNNIRHRFLFGEFLHKPGKARLVMTRYLFHYL